MMNFDDIFVVNDTANTEIYPDRTTLARHEALPISTSDGISPMTSRSGGASSSRLTKTKGPHRSTRTAMSPKSSLRTFSVASISGRSEEHTSELQSLMRLSYAVFCLKKKTKLRPTYRP